MYPHYLSITALAFACAVWSQRCQQGSDQGFPNCTEANTAFCESGPIIFRCFYPYGNACPGNCMDNLSEQYRDASCWESYPDAGDAQCAASCVSVTAKNGSTFYPYGCDNSTLASASPSLLSTSTSPTSPSSIGPISTSTTQTPSATTKSNGAAALWKFEVESYYLGFCCLLGLLTYVPF